MKQLSLVLFTICVCATGYAKEDCVPFDPVQTQHEWNKDLSYTATVGVMPIHDTSGHCMATMSYMAYTKNGASQNRPITFVYAGGPGCSSLTDNFLISGPKIVSLQSDGLKNNPETWLEFTDLVYIDMVGTGWGKVINPQHKKVIYTPSGDAETFSQFILSYVNRTNSLGRKLILAGESYGGFRTQLVVNHLLKHFVSVSGIILISPELDARLLDPSKSEIVDYVLYVPTFTRTALYHGLLPKTLADNPELTVEAATKWAINDYLPALLLGDRLSESERTSIAQQLSQYIGLSRETVQQNNLRIGKSIFRNSLVAGKTIDYLDSRLADRILDHDYGLFVLHMESFMSSQQTLVPKAVHYVLSDLKAPSKQTYINYFNAPGIWSQGEEQSVVATLHDNLIISPKTKVFVGYGHYDMDIPYYVTETAIAQLHLPESLRKNIALHAYPAGHMFYLDPTVRTNFFRDIQSFYLTQHLP